MMSDRPMKPVPPLMTTRTVFPAFGCRMGVNPSHLWMPDGGDPSHLLQ
jgi:hypothetical protein